MGTQVAGEIVGVEQTLVADTSTLKAHLSSIVADVEHDEQALRAKLTSIVSAAVNWIHSIDHKPIINVPVQLTSSPVTTTEAVTTTIVQPTTQSVATATNSTPVQQTSEPVTEPTSTVSAT